MTDRRALLLLAALATFAAFYPAFFGELPVPAGGGRLLLPDGSAPPDRNDELGDVPTQLLPPTKAAADAYRAGRLPFRMAAQGCGEPLWANPVAQCVTPTTLFFLFLPAAWASATGAAVKLLLAASGAFLFARSRRLSREASAWAGLAFGFSLYFTMWMHFPQPWAHAFFPWALLALERIARGERGGFRWTFSVVLLLLLGGYPEGEFFVALFGAVFFATALLRSRATADERLRRVGLAAAASILALGLTAAYTLPATIAIIRGERSVQVTRGTRALDPTFSPRDFLKPPVYWKVSRFWVVPEAQGNPRDQDKWGPYSFPGRTGGYAGILVLAFALSTFFWRGAPRTVRLARWGVVATAAYLLWYPPLVYVLQATPGLRELAFRLTSNRANGILILLVALLAAHELDRIRAGGRTLATRAGVLVALAATTLVTWEFAHATQRPLLTMWRAVAFVLPAVLLLTALALLMGRPAGRRLRVLTVFLVAGTAVDVLRIGARFNPGTRPEDYFPVTPKMRELQQAARGGRFASSEMTLTGMAYMYGLEDVRVHDATAPADYEDVLGVAAGYTGPAEYSARVTKLQAPILDFLNVRASLGPGAAIAAKKTPQAVLPEKIVGAAHAGELFDRLGRETDFLRRAHAIGADEAFSGAARILSYEKPRPEELRILVSTDSPRVLVIPETTDGGWTAEGNGVRLPVFSANGAFLALRVPAGEIEIVCRYVPPGFRAGLAISIASALILWGQALILYGRRLSPEYRFKA